MSERIWTLFKEALNGFQAEQEISKIWLLYVVM